MFGTEERFPGSVLDNLLEGDNPVEMQECLEDPVFRRAVEMREQAMKAVIELDADQRWKRALASGLTKSTKTYIPGSQVFFWKRANSTKNLKGRKAPLFHRWHGPAVVLGAQKASVPGHTGSEDSYWVAMGGTLYLVAKQHLRPATAEESLGNAVMTQVMHDMRGALAQNRPMLRYIDLRRRAAEERARRGTCGGCCACTSTTGSTCGRHRGSDDSPCVRD